MGIGVEMGEEGAVCAVGVEEVWEESESSSPVASTPKRAMVRFLHGPRGNLCSTVRATPRRRPRAAEGSKEMNKCYLNTRSS